MAQKDNFGIFDFLLLCGPYDKGILKDFPAEKYEHCLLPQQAILLIAKSETWQKKSDESGATFYFIGSVFNFPADLFETDGHYIGIRVDPKTGALSVFRNRYSPIGIYYGSLGNTRFVFSDFFGGFRKLDKFFNFSLATEDLADFFQFGMISFGRTLFKELHQLPFRQIMTLSFEKFAFHQEEPLHLGISAPLTPKEFYDLIHYRFGLWIKHTPYRSIAVSGGVDSRMVLSMLYEHQPERDITLHSRLHPGLTAEQDRDVIAAQQAVALLPYPHSLQTCTGHPSAYLSQKPPARPPVLSGLYGGEFLGGEFLNLANTDAVLTEFDSPFAALALAQRNPNRALEDDVELKLAIVSQASICDFYAGAWSNVACHHTSTLTPFWDSEFIAALSRIPAEQLRSYNFYRQIYKFIPEALQKLPLSSLINFYHKDLPTETRGTNPKEMAIPAPAVLNQKKWLDDFIPPEIHRDFIDKSRLEVLRHYLLLTGKLRLDDLFENSETLSLAEQFEL